MNTDQFEAVDPLVVVLEPLIDANGIALVVLALAEVCDEKASHFDLSSRLYTAGKELDKARGARAGSRAWRVWSKRLGRVAGTVARDGVTP